MFAGIYREFEIMRYEEGSRVIMPDRFELTGYCRFLDASVCAEDMLHLINKIDKFWKDRKND